MKIPFLFLVAAICAHAAELVIPDSDLRFRYDATAWSPIGSQSTDIWAFSDTLLYLGGAILRVDVGVDAKLSSDMIRELIGTGFDSHSVFQHQRADIHVFRDSGSSRERWTRYTGYGSHAYFVYVEEESSHLKVKRKIILQFLAGLIQKEKEPNNAMEPTPVDVTNRAFPRFARARFAPSTSAAHLRR